MKSKVKMKVFVVDDDKFRTRLVERYLQNLNFEDISIFYNGTDCLDHLIEEPDIIFLDYEMHDLNGLEVLKKIKRFNPNIYVVLLSGQTSMDVAVKSLKYGAFDYVIKEDDEFTRIEEVTNKILKVNELLLNGESKKPSRFHSVVGIVLIAAALGGFVYEFLKTVG